MDRPKSFATVGRTFLSAENNGPNVADKNVCPPGRTFAAAVAILLLASAALRLYRIDAPLVDCFWDKQVVVANLARSMAGPPFHLLNASIDFCISKDGRRMPTTEEIPVYYGLVAAGYRLFGEQDWFGRAVSGLGSVVAILAFVGLMRREFDDRFALLAGFFLAFSPLLLFYGRTVLPDPCMLAGMLAAAYCFRRALDQGGVTWVILSGVAGLAAVGFKYYGLMVLLPMAEMTWRQADRRKANAAKLALAAAIMIVPLAAWMLLVFFQTANPARGEAYFVFQMPAVLLKSKVWTRLFDNFLWKSCGPLGTVFLVMGVLATILRWAATGKRGQSPFAGTARRVLRTNGDCPLFPAPQMGAVLAWTAMGLGFYLLLAPKSVKHDYYELMMLPAAAAWAAIGLQALGHQARQWGMRPKLVGTVGVILLAATAVVQSPWVSGARFRPDTGFVLAAESAQKFCSERGRWSSDR